MNIQIRTLPMLKALSLLSMFMVSLTTESMAFEEKKKILIINSFSWGGVWADSEVQGFRSVLKQSGINVAFSIEQMDVIGKRGRFDPEYFTNHLKWRFSEHKFDLIVANDDPAFRFVAAKYHELFDGIPVVFVDVNNIASISIPADMAYTGVTEQNDFLSTLEIAKKLRPKARTIAVFGNARNNGAGPHRAMNFLKGLNNGLPFEFHLDKSFEEIAEISSKLTPEDIVFGLAYATDKNGVFRDYNEVRGAIGSASPAASFVFWKTADDDKFAIGGKVSSANEQGRAAATMATRVLAGEDIRSIPIMAAPTKYVFNYPIMTRMGISEESLPEGSEFLQRPFSLYESYKKEIWATIVVFIFLVVVIFHLLTNINRRKSAELALAASRDQLEEKVSIRTAELVLANETLNETVDQLGKTQDQLIESEKMAALGGLVSGVAHEINTPLGVSLMAVSHFEETTDKLLLNYEKEGLSRDRFESFLNSAGQTARILLSNLGRAANLISSFKQIAVDQSTEVARPIDLKDYIQTTAESLLPELKTGGHTIEIICQDNLTITTYPGIIAQILTNLVINSVRHGFGADRNQGKIQLDVTRSDKKVTLSYHDNGKGMSTEVLDRVFDPFFTTARGEGGSGLGLSIVYNLVTHKLSGQIKCESTLGEGTRFILTFPA